MRWSLGDGGQQKLSALLKSDDFSLRAGQVGQEPRLEEDETAAPPSKRARVEGSKGAVPVNKVLCAVRRAPCAVCRVPRAVLCGWCRGSCLRNGRRRPNVGRNRF